ncbi:MAG TPA: peptidylprolyl isomerase [Bacilli bacterium]|nr:peptidylprolyl isomerase [Bacilli bacterium]
MTKKTLLTTLLSTALVATLLSGCGNTDDTAADKTKQNADQTQQGGTDEPTATKLYPNYPEMTIDKSKEYTATLKTNKGDITIKLFDDQSPKTVNSFVFLAKHDFYDGVIFHRVIQDFMIQTGDPTGTGSGGPGYKYEDEKPLAKEYGPGIVAMANAGPNTNGSQFFICTGEQSKNLNLSLDNYYYTVFGEVVDGMDTVKKIAAVKVGAQPTGEVSRPEEEVKVNDVVIEEK